ncbi:MAG: hypothetical protein CMD83_03280 [Gammaproteobacteria bacterium]|nr:hypothetical protein [Gammaproteobacteria bacterium]
MSWQFVVSMPRPRELTVVERNPENLYVERARALGVHVLIGDVLDTNVLRKVNLHAAGHLVTFSGNDGTNVELAIKARNYMSTDPTSRQLRVHLHINDTRISAQLEEYAKFFDDSSAASVDFFSVYDLNARILMNEYPPEVLPRSSVRTRCPLRSTSSGALQNTCCLRRWATATLPISRKCTSRSSTRARTAHRRARCRRVRTSRASARSTASRWR